MVGELEQLFNNNNIDDCRISVTAKPNRQKWLIPLKLKETAQITYSYKDKE